MNWYSKIFRKVHWDFDNPPFLRRIGENFDPGNFVSTLKNSHIEAVNFFANDVFGQSYYESKVNKKHPGLKKDILKEITGLCRRNEVKIMFYLVAIDQNLGMVHPEWRHVYLGESEIPTPTGLPTGQNNMICLNSPYLKEVVIPQVNELLKYRPDGFFFDIVSQMLYAFCYCSFCQKKFQEEFGRDLPREKGDPFWIDALKWRRNVIDNFERTIANVIHQTNPQILFGSNNSYCIKRPQTPPDYLDYLSLDVPEILRKEGCRGALGSNILGISLEARYLSTLNKPFDIMNSFFLYWWGDWMIKPVATLKMECSTVIANGGRIFIGDKIYYDGTTDNVKMRMLKETFGFIKKREHLCQDTMPVPYIGVLHSDSTLLHNVASILPEGTGEMKALAPIQGAHKALVESGFHFNILNEDSLLKNISNYKVLILPEQDVLPEDVKECIEKFVMNGGGLVTSYPTSLFDILGIREEGGFYYSFGYIKVTDKSIMKGIGEFPVMTHGSFSKVKTVSAKCLASLCAPRWDVPSLSFGAPQGSIGEDTGYPAVTLHEFGKGKAVFISGSIFTAYWTKNNPHLKYLIRNIVNLAIQQKIIEVEGPASLEISLFQKGKKKIIHLTNFHIEKNIGGPTFAEEVPPLYKVKIRLKVEFNPKRVVQYPENRKVEFVMTESVVEFEVPEINIHTMIVVE